MKKSITLILALCSITFAQQPNSGGAGCQWLSVCAAGTICIFNPSLGVGCDSVTCEMCFRGLVALPTDGGKSLDLTRQFVGYFKKYRWKAYTAERLVIAMPGPLGDEGVQAGDVVSRIGKSRATRRLMMKALPLKGLTITTYTPGHANKPRRVRL